MIQLSTDLTNETSDISSTVTVTQVCTLTFAIQGTITGGTVDIQYKPDRTSDADWEDLDSTNLSFSAKGTGVADWGECQIRAKGSSLTTSDAVKVWIGGTYVHTEE